MFNDVTVFNIREYLSAKGDKDLGEDELKELQYMAGGMVIFFEAEDNDKLMHFYEDENGFKRFDTKEVKAGTENGHILVQFLKVL